MMSCYKETVVGRDGFHTWLCTKSLSCYKETVVRKGWFSHAARHQEPASLTQRDDPPQHTHTYTSVEKGDGGGTATAHCQCFRQKGLAVWLNCRVHKCIAHVHRACDRQAYACWDFPIPPFSPPLLSGAQECSASSHASVV